MFRALVTVTLTFTFDWVVTRGFWMDSSLLEGDWSTIILDHNRVRHAEQFSRQLVGSEPIHLQTSIIIQE